MRKRKKTSTFFYLILRKIGLLCRKKSKSKPFKIRIQKTIDCNGEVVNHEDFMFAKNNLPKIEIQGKNKKICHYDFRTHTCRCGLNINDLKKGKKCPTVLV